MDSDLRAGVVTFLFTDIEGSTRLWEQQPDKMRGALACHDGLTRRAIEGNSGTVVKMVGDGVCAAFAEPLHAVVAAVQLQQVLADPQATNDIPLRIRCGLHVGLVEQRDNDYFGVVVNRAARIMSAAHGGQILLSQAVVDSVHERLPAGVALRELGPVRLRDLASPERVYQILHSSLRRDFPALRSLEATPNNLPQQVTSFVGRSRELAEVKELLLRTRLLTLVGTGGMGKTRLSLHVAAELLEGYPDGVWFVELAPVADARLVPQAVASVLGVKEEAGRPVLEALLKCVADRHLLVILDNCEHLVHACAELATRLLAVGMGVKVLASSREPLHMSGETTYPIPPLAQPDALEAVSPEMVWQYEAVRLFVDRAQAVQPAFAVTPANAPALAAICQRLDGIPLAIELAAVRVRVLSVEKIAARLDDRFRLLTGGSRANLPRQQTLRALIDWSYDLLSPQEQTLFMRLCVFAGGFTLEAAEAVGADDPIDASNVLDLLVALVEKSLVEPDAARERYRMLETVSAYGHKRLAAAGDVDLTRARHFTFFLALAERAASELWGTEQRKWIETLDRERENLLSALAWCGDRTERAEQSLRFVTKLQLYWLPSGMLEVGYRVTTEALAKTAAQAPTGDRCGALYAASQLAYFLGQFRDTALHAEQSLEIAREIGDDGRALDALLMMGYAEDELGDRGAAFVNYEAAIALARHIGDKARLSYALNALAGHYIPGDEAAGLPLYEEATALAREVGDIDAAAISLQNIGRALIALDQGDRARGHLLESLETASKIGATRTLLYVLDVCVALADQHIECKRSARFLAAANAQLERFGIHRTAGDNQLIGPSAEHARAALGEPAFAEVTAAGRELTLEEVIAEAKAWLAGEPLQEPRSIL
jgi:predicted ATPase/class 3 adenylate cyclase